MNNNREKLEEKYNINLDIQTKLGEKTYWDLRNYFTKEIEQDKLLISKDFITLCCHRTDIESIKEEFNNKLKELTENESNEICENLNSELLESAVGRSCQYSNESSSSINNEDKPPPYK